MIRDIMAHTKGVEDSFLSSTKGVEDSFLSGQERISLGTGTDFLRDRKILSYPLKDNKIFKINPHSPFLAIPDTFEKHLKKTGTARPGCAPRIGHLSLINVACALGGFQ